MRDQEAGSGDQGEHAPSAGSRPPRRLFGRRKGRPLSAHREGLVEALLPRLRPVWDEGQLIDLPALFGKSPSRLVLEVGFGGGERLASHAKSEPETSFIGCEPFANGVAKLLAAIEKDNIPNIRIQPDDAGVLMDALPDRCLDLAFVLFADPWPKKRHAERRFIGPKNLDRFARLLKPSGELRLATDVPVLADWMREKLAERADFEQLYDSETPPEGWVATRYETKGRAAGRVPVYMGYRYSPSSDR